MLIQVVQPNGDGKEEDVDFQAPFPVAIVQDMQQLPIQVRSATPAQVTVTTSATLIARPNSNRRSLLLTNLTGTQLCYLGTDNGVSSTLGRAVLTGAVGSNMTIYTKEAIYGIAAVASQTIAVWEEEYVNV